MLNVVRGLILLVQQGVSVGLGVSLARWAKALLYEQYEHAVAALLHVKPFGRQGRLILQ